MKTSACENRRMLVSGLFLPGALADDIARALLGLHIDLADILGDDAEADQLHAADEADDAGHARPAGDRPAAQRGDQGPDTEDEAHEGDEQAEPEDQTQGLDGQARHAVDREAEHLLEGIVALARHALGSGVADGGGLEADEGHHAAQVEVDLLEVGKLLEHAGADEAVVGVVEDDLGPHGGEELVEALGGEALEEGVGLPAGAHAVDHLAAVEIGVDHLVHSVDVVLTVAVDGDGDVTLVARLHEPGEHRVLVAAVAALADADIVLVLCGELADDLPGLVLAAVVDEEDAAVLGDLARGAQVPELLQEQRSGQRKDRLLIVAGDDDKKSGLGHDVLLSSPGRVSPAAAKMMRMGISE